MYLLKLRGFSRQSNSIQLCESHVKSSVSITVLCVELNPIANQSLYNPSMTLVNRQVEGGLACVGHSIDVAQTLHEEILSLYCLVSRIIMYV